MKIWQRVLNNKMEMEDLKPEKGRVFREALGWLKLCSPSASWGAGAGWGVQNSRLMKPRLCDIGLMT